MLFAVFNIAAIAQTQTQNKQPDSLVFYLDKNEQLATDSAGIAFVRIIKRDTADQTLFTVEDYYKNGRLKQVGKSLVASLPLQRTGSFLSFFPNGRRKSIENFQDGRIDGDQYYYYPNGKAYCVSTYDYSNQKIIVKESNDSTGKVMASNGNGAHILYDENFKQILEQGPILDGTRNGEWTGTVYDTIYYKCTYSHGNSVSGTSRTKSGRVYNFTNDFSNPEFQGGEFAFYKFLAHNIKYPPVARDNKVQGKVFINFTIDSEGKLSKFAILRGIGSGCDEEAIRVLSLSPPWIPGKIYGVPVKVSFTFPISYSIASE